MRRDGIHRCYDLMKRNDAMTFSFDNSETDLWARQRIAETLVESIHSNLHYYDVGGEHFLIEGRAPIIWVNEFYDPLSREGPRRVHQMECDNDPRNLDEFLLCNLY